MNSGKLQHDVLIITGCTVLSLLLCFVTDSWFNAFICFMMLAVYLFLAAYGRDVGKDRQRFFQLAAVMLVLMTLEVAALLYFRFLVLNAEDLPRYNFGLTRYWTKNNDLGYGPRPSTLVRARKKLHGYLVYDAEYRFSPEGLRETRSDRNAGCAFVFFGGSRMFGEGLSDIQTLPYQFSLKLNYNQDVRNHAFHGYGPHQMLRTLETNTPALPDGRIGAVFYLYEPDDIFKIAGELELFRRGPRYILEGDILGYAGDLTGTGGMFNSPRDFGNGILTLLRYSQVFNFLYKLTAADGVLHDEDYYQDLLFRLITESAGIISEKYKSRLVMIINRNDYMADDLVKYLSASNIEHVELQDVLAEEWGDQYLLGDGDNFNEKTNDETATALANRYGDCR